MNLSFLKGIFISALAMLFSLSVYADSTGGTRGTDGDFQTICTNAWIKKADEAKDKVDFKNFGEKYCSCAAKQQLGNAAAIQKAAQVCISRTLLHDAMDSIEDDMGLNKAKDTDIADYCQDRWDLIMPKQTDEDKKFISAYCECAKLKLVDLVKRSNDITDKQYSDEIDSVADACADNVVASKSTSTQ